MLTNFKVGDKVLFGRGLGEKTLGEILKVNSVKLKVKQLEARGTMRDYKIGTIWTVPPSLCEFASAQRATILTPLVELPRMVPATVAFKVGDKVAFNGPHKRTILGTVDSIGPKNIMVLEHGKLGKWKVPPMMLRAWSGADAPAEKAGATVAAQVKAKRPDVVIMRDIMGVYGDLSPENLSWDGERSRSEMNAAARYLNAKLRGLFTEIGRHVSEDQAYAAFGTAGSYDEGKRLFVRED